MKRLHVFLLCCFIVSSAHAGENRLAVIRKIQGTEILPENLTRQLERSTLHITAQQPGFELLLADQSAPNQTNLDAVAIEGQVGKGPGGYRIETRLIDLKTRKLIGKAALDDIREEDLLRMYEGAIQRIFEPFVKAAKEREKKLLEKNPRESVSPSEKPRKQPSTTQVNYPDPQTLDFRKRVQDLKMGVDENIAETNEKTAAQAKQQNKQPQSQMTSSGGLPSQVSQADVPFPKVRPQKKFDPLHCFYTGYSSRTVNSIYFVDTSTKATFLTVGAQGHYPLTFFDGKIAASYDLLYNRTISAPVELPDVYELGGYLSYLSSGWNVSGGILRDTNFFVNLPDPGAGLQTKTITSMWGQLKSEVTLDYKGPWIVSGTFGIPLMVSTNYSPLKKVNSWGGNMMNISVSPPYHYKNFFLNLEYEKLNITAQGERPFTLNDSRFALYIRRSL